MSLFLEINEKVASEATRLAGKIIVCLLGCNANVKTAGKRNKNREAFYPIPSISPTRGKLHGKRLHSIPNNFIQITNQKLNSHFPLASGVLKQFWNVNIINKLFMDLLYITINNISGQ